MDILNRKNVIRYAVLPGFKPRIQGLLMSGFQYIPFFMALVYQAVRLLPYNHPYTNAANLGKFGMRHVIGEAANNLVISRRNIDQVILFFSILLGLATILVQLGLLAMSFFVQPVLAATMPTSFAGFFLTPAASAPNDLAYIFMDLVFGIPDLFNSCVATAADCLLDIDSTAVNGDGLVDPWTQAGLSWPFPIHHAMHQMLTVYSLGLLSVAVFVTLYFGIVILVETAQTGTPFGKRFNKVWAPIRIVVAFGLLIPIANGLNASQYIVLYAAKFGSGFATNGWNIFNSDLTSDDTYLGKKSTLVTKPNVPEVTELLQFLYTARTCYEIENIKNGEKEIEPYLVGDSMGASSNLNINDVLSTDFSTSEFNTSYEQMINFAKGSSKVSLRFGYLDDDNNTNSRGSVKPVCGELTINLPDPRITDPEPAADIMQRYYWYVIMELWYDVLIGDPPEGFDIEIYADNNYPLNLVCTEAPYAKPTDECPENTLFPLPSNQYRADLQQFYKDDLNALLNDPATTGINNLTGYAETITEAQANSDRWDAPLQAMQQKGWAGAGLWYSKVAELNGTISAAMSEPPAVTLWPETMERTMKENIQHAEFVDIKNRFNPQLRSVGTNVIAEFADKVDAFILWHAFNYWQDDGAGSSSETTATNNVLIDTINALLGTEGLYTMSKNPDAHPLAQLVGVGRSFINSAIGNLADASALSLLSAGIGGSQGIAAITGFIMTIVMIALTAGFLLFYIIPFLPFIYFFFAVGGWVKGILEAMVGAPLWALAHIRIDGNGLPGSAAVSGYFLIFEIFLRPILIVFGLLASISIFSALVSVMNDTWLLVTKNLGGFDPTVDGAGALAQAVEYMRNPIDEFFFTVIYTIVVYLMAMSSFKLIDLIPNNILRWMGQSIPTFNDEGENPAEGLSARAAVGTQQGVSAVGGGVQGALTKISSGLK